ncbi:MBL fold metallo-hydrolase [Methanomicrobium antiquum]|uniref:MBL fold metallo-hydrolase n=1 Tax=Methanomicrobium antiquum TaxID=487686 RepID=A0AAF0FNW8_9EURY|nr:rhodanese-like domain-containing protein [Methanomicrobium antiquum]WFN37728.1 MBL fold metallo-hydrolase [Methanomicrobium antiquum]
MLLKQFFIDKIAHSSYLIGGNQTCAIVDPSRDIDWYLEAAEEEGLRITHIIETHLHADFVSGHLDLADATGAEIYAPKAGNCTFKHVAVEQGDEFIIEDMKFHVLETPGHTPDCLVYAVSDLSRGEEPVLAFTGDTLFVNDVGRPDLFPGRAKELAEKLYHNLHDKVMKLPDSCFVLPAHGAGSLCGKAMGSMRFSTIGYEKQHNPALLIKDINEFVKSLTEDMPPAPDHFARCSDINRKGPVLVKTLSSPKPMSPKDFREKSQEGNTIIVSLRDYATFGGQHIPGSYHIDVSGNFSTFAGWILPPDKDILLVTNDPKKADKATVMLRRVGLDRAFGYLRGGTHAWVMSGYETEHIYQLSPAEVHEKITKEGYTLLDVRSKDEFDAGHVKGAINILGMDLRTEYTKLESEKPVIAMCGSGHRSSIACSILKQKGFKYVYNAAGGITGYRNAGFLKS